MTATCTEPADEPSSTPIYIALRSLAGHRQDFPGSNLGEVRSTIFETKAISNQDDNALDGSRSVGD